MALLKPVYFSFSEYGTFVNTNSKSKQRARVVTVTHTSGLAGFREKLQKNTKFDFQNLLLLDYFNKSAITN